MFFVNVLLLEVFKSNFTRVPKSHCNNSSENSGGITISIGSSLEFTKLATK